MNLNEAFKILEIKPGSSEEEIKAAYRKLAKRWHPDINKEPEAENKFKQINQAYERLTKSKDTLEYEIFTNPFDSYFTGFQSFSFNQRFSNRSRSKSSLTLYLDDFPPGTAERIIKILSENGINISSYNIQNSS